MKYFSILPYCSHRAAEVGSRCLVYPYSFLGRTLNGCVNCFITPFSVPSDQMGKPEVSSRCRHGDLAVNHIWYKDTG